MSLSKVRIFFVEERPTLNTLNNILTNSIILLHPIMKNCCHTLQILLCLLIISSLSFAQTNDISPELGKKLEGLTQGMPDVIQDIILDGERFPIYQLDGTQVKGGTFAKLMMSGKYEPEFYINDKQEIKACVLTLLPAEKQKAMKEEMEEVKKESETAIKEVIPFSGLNMDGKRISSNDLKGKVVVINFWFTGCKPCMQEMPALNELVQKYKRKQVIFVAITFNNKEEVATFLASRKFDYHILPDSQRIILDYKVFSYPTHLILDKQGKVALSSTGLDVTTIKDLDFTIEKLLK